MTKEIRQIPNLLLNLTKLTIFNCVESEITYTSLSPKDQRINGNGTLTVKVKKDLATHQIAHFFFCRESNKTKNLLQVIAVSIFLKVYQEL